MGLSSLTNVIFENIFQKLTINISYYIFRLQTACKNGKWNMLFICLCSSFRLKPQTWPSIQYNL